MRGSSARRYGEDDEHTREGLEMVQDRRVEGESARALAARALLGFLGLVAALAGCGDADAFDAGDGGTDTDTDADTDGDSDADGGSCAEEWYDSASGLSWAVLPSGAGEMTWQSAADYCGGYAVTQSRG